MWDIMDRYRNLLGVQQWRGWLIHNTKSKLTYMTMREENGNLQGATPSAIFVSRWDLAMYEYGKASCRIAQEGTMDTSLEQIQPRQHGRRSLQMMLQDIWSASWRDKAGSSTLLNDSSARILTKRRLKTLKRRDGAAKGIKSSQRAMLNRNNERSCWTRDSSAEDWEWRRGR